jgi:hypothetical protein
MALSWFDELNPVTWPLPKEKELWIQATCKHPNSSIKCISCLGTQMIKIRQISQMHFDLYA